MYGFRGFILGVLCELKNYLRGVFNHSYSQKDEDVVIDKYFNYKNNGFYVDVGAYDPTRLSNTKRFYKKGWRGINIEPDINGYSNFLQQRPEDINLNIGIGKDNKELTFYVMTPNTLSTFSEEEKNEYLKKGYYLKETSKVQVLPLKDVLNNYCKDREIDFMSIDAEGHDMEVLESNDWDKYKPKIICIESYIHSKEVLKNSEFEKYLNLKGYEEFYDNQINSLYKLKI